ncbi:hypothetical protein EVAR_8907_1 [Eumeta japonica]|uniref:Uncharacterized protein n=1 Tax=Eumeta variegata TaxID=151549 RepID=A0A4C1U0J2_EUMVA|nr:hypothetical protein EVAR_8907_1 [Eumeta japonica]
MELGGARCDYGICTSIQPDHRVSERNRNCERDVRQNREPRLEGFEIENGPRLKPTVGPKWNQDRNRNPKRNRERDRDRRRDRDRNLLKTRPDTESGNVSDLSTGLDTTAGLALNFKWNRGNKNADSSDLCSTRSLSSESNRREIACYKKGPGEAADESESY